MKFAAILRHVELELNEDNDDYRYVKELINHKENAVVQRQSELPVNNNNG